MTGYWIRHRLLYSIILSVVLAVVSVLLFVSPLITQKADDYNSQSLYKNTSIDFIAPEPSYDQIAELPGTNGIDKIFPFFLTKTSVKTGDSSRTTTVLLSDDFDNIDFTMYNSKRLIRKSDSDYENPILVDRQFCKDTSAEIGDTVSFTIGGASVEYKIYAIYETNSVYDGGAVLAKISKDQKNRIKENSQNNGYSGCYIAASDYSACQSYLTKDYRPLGRLKNRDQFDSEEQYKIHYDAIMTSGYSNEITDFRIKENNLEKESNGIMIWIGSALTFVVVVICSILLSRRGNEKGYFKNECIPKGRRVKPYYIMTFVFELIVFLVSYSAILVLKIKFSSIYISKSVLGYEIAVIPAAFIIAEAVSLILSSSMIKGLEKKGR